jgi:hypothetical protein
MAETETQETRESAPGFEDELDAKRRQVNGAAAPAGDADGETLEDRVANGAGTPPTATDDDGQEHFVWEHGQKVTFGNLIKRHTDVEYRVKFGGMSVKGRGEPVPLDAKDMVLIGRYYSGGMEFVPTHDDEGKVEKVTVYVTLKPQGAPVDLASPEGKLILPTPSIADVVTALLEDGVEEAFIRSEVDKALAGA